MAIYHLHVNVGKRANGNSAHSKASYLARSGKFKRHKGKCSAIITGNMPEWVGDAPEKYWKAADQYERANGKLYSEVEFALPRELELFHQIELAKQFVAQIANRPTDTNGGLPFTLYIHNAGEGNPHCHVLLSERANDGISRDSQQWFKRYNPSNPDRGGAKKTRSLQPKFWLENVRALWASVANEYLSGHGIDESIDHRSYKVQGIERIPGVHLGPKSAHSKKVDVSPRHQRNIWVGEVNQEIDRIIDQNEKIERRVYNLGRQRFTITNATENGNMPNPAVRDIQLSRYKKRLFKWDVAAKNNNDIEIENSEALIVDKGLYITLFTNSINAIASSLLKIFKVKGWGEVKIAGHMKLSRALNSAIVNTRSDKNLSSDKSKKSIQPELKKITNQPNL